MQLFVVVVLLLSHVAMVAAVAGCHSDRDKDHRPRENCTSASYSDIPPGIEPTTKVLLFPSNLFSSLSWSSFQIFPEIYEIDFTGNKIPEVTPSGAPVLPSLSVLRLGSNRLASLSEGSFSACPALTELYLYNNFIVTLSDHTFSGLSKLEILDLSSNRIRVLPLLLLHPLPAIETLLLENNKIKVLPDNWFIQKEEVPYLYLSANPWACSCSLGYLRRYLDDYELNIYVRDGPIIRSDGESVVCDSPQGHKGKPVITLEESELCSSTTDSGPTGDLDQWLTPYMITTEAIPVTTTPTWGRSRSNWDRSILTTLTLVTTPTPDINPIPVTTLTPDTTPTPDTTTTPTPDTTPTLDTTPTPDTTSTPTPDTTAPPVTTTTPTPTTNTPTPTTIITPPPARTTPHTKAAPTTVTSTMPKPRVVTIIAATEVTTVSTPSWVIDKVADDQLRSQFAGAAAGVFCFWLFAGAVLLCVAAAVCALVTLASLVIWYRRVYRPLSVMLARRRKGGGEGVRLLTYSQREEQKAAGGGGGGVMALYRTVLFISREEGEAKETGGGGRGVVTLEPIGGGGATGEEEKEGGREERGVYKKTIYRLVSKQEEVEGWRDVMEECRVSAGDGGRREGGMGGGGVSSKRYSVILREERDEAGGGTGEVDWVVGGWEVKRGEGEEPRSSWGEWLAHYLPSMPWGVTTPTEGEAAQ